MFGRNKNGHSDYPSVDSQIAQAEEGWGKLRKENAAKVEATQRNGKAEIPAWVSARDNSRVYNHKR